MIYTIYSERRKLGQIEALDNGLWRANTKVGTGIFPNKTRALDAFCLKDDYRVIRIVGERHDHDLDNKTNQS